MIAIDETKIKADGERCHVWAAIDVDTRELLAVWVSWQRNIMHAEAFLEKRLKHAQPSQHSQLTKAHGIPKPSRRLALNGNIEHSACETALNAGSEP